MRRVRANARGLPATDIQRRRLDHPEYKGSVSSAGIEVRQKQSPEYGDEQVTKLRDEQFVARVWEEANKRLTAERLAIEKEIDANFAEPAKAHAARDRYFKAFEAGKLEPDLCNEKVLDLRTQLEELEGRRQDLEDGRERLELPVIEREMLSDLLDHFEKVMADGTPAQEKDLLRWLVKKVRVHDRPTIEVSYGLPNRRAFESWSIWLH